MTRKKMEQIVFPVVRVRHANAGGSGTVLYSDEEDTFALTNNHVIEGAVRTGKYWDPYREKKRKKENYREVTVEFFDWEGMNKQFAREKFNTDIVMRDGEIDLALLRFDTPEPYQHTATAIDKDRIKNIKVFDEVWAVGASLGHEPIPTKGHIMYLPERIDNHKYVMSCSPTIYGNSGGAQFREYNNEYEYVGVPSRITVAPMGFSGDPQPHMSYWLHPEEIYKFLEKWHFDFILDPSKERKDCKKRREKKIEKERNKWAVRS